MKSKKTKQKPFNSEGFLVKPHTKKSRPVTNDDISQIIGDGLIMLNICRTPVGIKNGGFALAHAQVNDKDPMRFFVLRDGAIIINPKIVEHTNHKIQKVEGCLSYAWEKDVYVGRYHKITMEYQTITKENTLSEVMTLKFKGISAEIIQHEIDHMEGIYIYTK